METNTNKTAKTANYRDDIDGLRALAVLAVIFFHFGYVANGYLGVDVFFVISGYLITGIVYNESLENRFSIFNFYLRRIRRIIPLVLFCSLTALVAGFIVMLPDDFENLSQSVFATNFFANNILLLITSGDYWNIVNEFKPLMHTWSLGIEEQFYLLYPLLFVVFSGKRIRYLTGILVSLTVVSFFLFIFSGNEGAAFYLIQYRFFELATGGLAAIALKDKVLKLNWFSIVLVILLTGLLFLDFKLLPAIKHSIVVVLSAALLVSGPYSGKLYQFLFENKLMRSIGKISFSLYMWHQIVLAFTRYFIVDNIGVLESLRIMAITAILSVLTYNFIEKPFRDKTKTSTGTLLTITVAAFLIITCSSYYFYSIGGIVRDVPELDISKARHKINHQSAVRNIHIEYNARIYDLDKPFSSTIRTKVLIIGNSFARDFANILLESKSAQRIEISYLPDISTCKDLAERIQKADCIIFSELDISQFAVIQKKYNMDTSKVWDVGTKNFGSNNGIFYNHKRDTAYYKQRTRILALYSERNNELKVQWGKKYIDLIALISDQNGTIPVFTPDCKFISQDCKHLTHAGALYFAHLFDEKKLTESIIPVNNKQPKN